jgi:hypothetical protein
MKRKLAANRVNLHVTAAIAAVVGTLSIPAPASAVTINDLFVFGDSYSDTGAFFPLTNGSTAVGYLANNFNITLTTQSRHRGRQFRRERRSHLRRSEPAGHATEKPDPTGRGISELRYL